MIIPGGFFVMMYAMPSSLRHLIALVLLVLLPLQAIASVVEAASAPVVTCSDQMMASGCCDHDDAGAACRASACFAIAAVAPPLVGAVGILTSAGVAAVPAVSRIYTSYIADGPQRPPCHHS